MSWEIPLSNFNFFNDFFLNNHYLSSLTHDDHSNAANECPNVGGGSDLPTEQNVPAFSESKAGGEEGNGNSDKNNEEQGRRLKRVRLETWREEESMCLINIRRLYHHDFNTVKCHKPLWEAISTKMRECGWAKTGSMCCEKWRNMLKAYRKEKSLSGPWKEGYKPTIYEDVVRYCEKKIGASQPKDKNAISSQGCGTSLYNALHHSVDDNGIPLGPHEAQAIVDEEAHGNWRENPTIEERDGGSNGARRSILVKFNDCTKRIGIGISREAIKEVIRSSFGIRSERAFYLRGEDGILWGHRPSYTCGRLYA